VFLEIYTVKFSAGRDFDANSLLIFQFDLSWSNSNFSILYKVGLFFCLLIVSMFTTSFIAREMD
jgi:hypothetical protein